MYINENMAYTKTLNSINNRYKERINPAIVSKIQNATKYLIAVC